MKSLPVFQIVRSLILLVVVMLLIHHFPAVDQTDQLADLDVQFTTNEKGVVESITLPRGWDDEKSFHTISKLNSVTHVDLSGVDPTDHLIKRLTELSGLQRITWRESAMTRRQILMLASGSLESLDLSYSNGEELSLDLLNGFPSLRHLSLEGCEWTAQGDASVIGTLKELETLNLCYSRISTSIVPHIAKLPRLQHLDISGCDQFSTAEIEQLTNPSLRLVRFLGVAVDASDVESWRAQRRKTEIWYDQMLSPDLQWLGPSRPQAGHQQGRIRSIACHIEEPADFHILRHLAKLQTVKLTGPGADNAVIPYLRDMSLIVELDLTHSSVTAEGIAQLPVFRKLRSAKLSGTAVSDSTLQWLARQPSLAELALLECELTDEDLSFLSHMDLRTINLSRNNISGTGLRNLNMESLRNVSLAGCPITREGLQLLKQFEHLNALDLSCMTITDDVIDAILALQPSHLLLQDTDLSHSGALRISQSGPIDTLDVRGSTLSHELFERLGQTQPIHTLLIDGERSLLELVGSTRAANNVSTLILAEAREESLTELFRFNGLLNLEMQGATITSESARNMVQHPSLKGVTFRNCVVAPEAKAILQANVEITSPRNFGIDEPRFERFAYMFD
ncbi:MAG: hypothetical protein KDA91_14165 [Planctomycetaceae bacterium]|nr:hypothetical protein [Planctomycetaceae bacterium]